MPSQLVLTPAQFVAKWTECFAYNQWEEIDDADFREFTTDLAATFGTPAVNVPTYLAGSDYTAGFLVRYSQAGGRESFYYALLDGKLPHPTYNQTDANWKLVPGPVPETQLYQYITLDEAGSIEGNGVVAGRGYGVVGKWNGSANNQLVFLDGLENYFRRRGTLLMDDGTQQEVVVDVAAGTYTLAAAGVAYTAGPGIAIAGGVISTTGSSVASYQLPGAKRQQVAYANQLLLPEPDAQFLGKQFYDQVTLPGSLFWFRCSPFPQANGGTVQRWVRQFVGQAAMQDEAANPDLPQLDPWPPQPWQHGAESAGGTGYLIPPIPGAQFITFWLQVFGPRLGEEYLLDTRETGDGSTGAYFYNGGFGGLMYGYTAGAPTPGGTGFDFAVMTLSKMLIVSDFSQGLRLFCRAGNMQFFRPHKASLLTVYGRQPTVAEAYNPRGSGPADALLAQYDFQDLRGGILRDVSGNGHHGTLIGTMPTVF